MFTSITKYFFSPGRENSSENEADETKTDQDGWVFVEKPSEYYGDYEDNAEDDDNDRGYSPIRSSIHRDGDQYQGGFLVPPPPPPRSPKINGHLSRSRHMSGGSVTKSGDELDQREDGLSSDERNHQHSDFERYRGPFWNILEDEEQEMKKEGGVLSSASSQPEIVHIPSHTEHWILSPAPCFGGKPETCLKGSMEDLLIERPTTSIYLKFMGKNGVNKNGVNKNGLKGFSPPRRMNGDSLENEDVSDCFHNEKNNFDSFDSRLVTCDAIFPHKNSNNNQEKENEGWSSESSTRDHSLSRPPIRSFVTRHEHQSLQREESSEMSEGMQQQACRDPRDDLPVSKFLLPFEDDEVRMRGKRKLLNKHQRSHRTGLWQKPRKVGNFSNGCK